MITKKQSKKSKKKIFTSFYKYYFFITIASFSLIIIIFFNSEFWTYYKIKLLPRLDAYGILNYSKLPEVLLLKIKGHFTKVDKIFINIKFKEQLKIENEREQVIKETNANSVINNLTFEFNNYKAKIIFNNKTYNAKIRLKGDRNSHWKEKIRSSYRISLNKNGRILGLKKFSLQKPRARNYIYEWIFHELNSETGLIKLKYDFINLYVNGENLGLYVIEEFFSKHLLERNHRRDGPIFSVQENFTTKFINTKFEVYDKKTWLNEKNIELTKNASNKLRAFINSEIKASEIIDLDKWAWYMASSDLLGTYHGTNLKSQKFYYNVLTGKFEPIPYDGHYWNPILSSVSQEKRDEIIIDQAGKKFDIRGAVNYATFLGNKLVQEEIFAKKYFNALKKISSKEFLDNFFEKRKKKINKINSLIYSDYFFNDFIHFYGPGIYYFHKDKIYKRAETIRKKINSDKFKIFAYYENDKIKIENYNIFNPFVFAKKAYCIKKNQSKLEEVIIFINLPVTLKKNTNLNKINNLNCYQLNIHNELTNQNIKISIDKINIKRKVIVQNYNFLKYFVNKNNKLILKNSDTRISENIFIPRGHKVIIRPGEKIVLDNNAFIFSSSPVKIGYINSDKIVKINGKKNNFGGGFIVVSSEKSEIYNCEFKYLNGIQNQNFFSKIKNEILITEYNEDKKINFTNKVINNKSGFKKQNINLEYLISGSITFYGGKIILKNIFFEKINSEDVVNIVSADFDIENLKFLKINSDAIDIDFGNGIAKQVYFEDIGNDAIDFSGSNSTISNLYFKNIGDKAISVGEKSNLNITDINIDKGFVGIASKDGSVTELRNALINNVKIGYAAYQKKYEYPNASKLIIQNDKINNFDKKFLKNKNSQTIYNNTSVEDYIDNTEIINILYKNKYKK